MRKTPTRSWRGVSAEQRRAERRAQLVEAGLETIGTRGWADTTVRSVCRAAGLTERYFYEAFADRDALLLAVYDRVVAEGVSVVVNAVAEAPRDFRRTVHAAIAAGVDFVVDDPRKGRILALEAAANERLQRRRQEAVRGQAALLARMSAEWFGTGSAEEIDAHLNALSVVGMLVEVGTAYLDGSLDVPRERLVDHIAAVVVAASGVTSRAHR